MYTEIFKLNELLNKNNIPHDFLIDEALSGYKIAYPRDEVDEDLVICTAIQNSMSYGEDEDLIEITSGLLTPDEFIFGTAGYLTAEEVFDRINQHYKTNINETKLKPCPFCGSRAVLKETPHIPKGIDYTPTCTNPSCAGRVVKKWTNRKEAIEAWNRRVE